MNEDSLNLATMPRMIMETGYKIEEWSQERGLIFRNPQGELVPTFLDETARWVPFLVKREEDNGRLTRSLSAFASLAKELDQLQADVEAEAADAAAEVAVRTI